MSESNSNAVDLLIENIIKRNYDKFIEKEPNVIEHWNAITAAQDALRDIELAITCYQSKMMEDEIDDDSMCYLLVYGLLQAVSLQYQAINTLKESLKINSITNYAKFRKFIQIRHDLVAHPFKKSADKEVYSYFVSRSNLSLKNITYWEFKK